MPLTHKINLVNGASPFFESLFFKYMAIRITATIVLITLYSMSILKDVLNGVLNALDFVNVLDFLNGVLNVLQKEDCLVWMILLKDLKTYFWAHLQNF